MSNEERGEERGTVRERDRAGEREGGSKLPGVSSYKDTKPIGTFVTLFNLYYCLIVLIFKYSHIGAQGLQHMNLGRGAHFSL